MAGWTSLHQRTSEEGIGTSNHLNESNGAVVQGEVTQDNVEDE